MPGSAVTLRSAPALFPVLRAAILLLSLLPGGCAGRAAPQPVELDENGVAILPEEDGTKRITPQQVAFLSEKGIPFLFVDSRGREAHAQERPAGSVSIPLSMTEMATSRLPDDRLIVTFCT
ncbi:MAG: hypothetical protein H0V09_12045 [Gemmatimonadetes bacterium]|nr:hypothetical protein [Gemmatimonadota bacterium]